MTTYGALTSDHDLINSNSISEYVCKELGIIRDQPRGAINNKPLVDKTVKDQRVQHIVVE